MDATDAYPDRTAVYARTLVAATTDVKHPYVLDVFRVKGGKKHDYMLYSSSFLHPNQASISIPNMRRLEKERPLMAAGTEYRVPASYAAARRGSGMADPYGIFTEVSVGSADKGSQLDYQPQNVWTKVEDPLEDKKGSLYIHPDQPKVVAELPAGAQPGIVHATFDMEEEDKKTVRSALVEDTFDFFRLLPGNHDYNGYLTIPNDSVYTFHFRPGSKGSLSIGGAEVVTPRDYRVRGNIVPRRAWVKLKKGYVPIHFIFNGTGGGKYGGKGFGFWTKVGHETLTTQLHNRKQCHTELWITGYGAGTDSSVAKKLYKRYQQLPGGPVKAKYKELILACAKRYLTTTPNLAATIYPRALSGVIWHMLDAYELSGEKPYLDRANFFALIAQQGFLDADSPLPKASSVNDHYEAITGGHTLMMTLLRLWQVQAKPEAKLNLFDNH